MSQKRKTTDASAAASAQPDSRSPKRTRRTQPDSAARSAVAAGPAVSAVPDPSASPDTAGYNDSSSPDSSSSISSSSFSSSASQSDSDPAHDDDDNDDEEPVITLGGPRKPPMQSRRLLTGASDLRARLSALLPQLQQANAALAGDEAGANLEAVDGDAAQWIEMDLGLGVLEEKRGDESSESSGVEEGAEEDGHETWREAEIGAGTGAGDGGGGGGRAAGAERDVMGRLLGVRRPGARAGIQVVDDGADGG